MFYFSDVLVLILLFTTKYVTQYSLFVKIVSLHGIKVFVFDLDQDYTMGSKDHNRSRTITAP